MNSQIIRKLRMERGDKLIPLPRRDRDAIALRQYLDISSRRDDLRCTDERQRDYLAAGESRLAVETAELAPIRISSDGYIHHSKMDKLVILDFFGKKNHARASAEYRHATGNFVAKRFEEPGVMQELALDCGFASRQNQCVEMPRGIAQLANFKNRRAQTGEAVLVFDEGSLQSQNSDRRHYLPRSAINN